MDRLISEQAVIESIEFFQMNPQHFDFVNLIDDIKEIPSAEPKTGHWIIKDGEEQGKEYCAECDHIEMCRWYPYEGCEFRGKSSTERKGKWIADIDRWGDIITTVNGYRCSECNAFNTDKDNYCPNCGCRMVEPQESEDKE